MKGACTSNLARVRRLTLAIMLCTSLAEAADEGFLRFLWGKQEPISEPPQKALVIHSGGREVLVLQLKTENATGRTGWLIPVPVAPKIEAASMEPFYEASRLMEQPLYPNEFTVIPAKMESYESVMRIQQVKINRLTTTRDYRLAVISDANALRRWITANHLDFSKDQATLDAYTRRGWQFVSVSGDFRRAKRTIRTNAPPGIELAPLSLSFDCPNPILPRALESNRRAPADFVCLLLSREARLAKPILAKAIVARKTEYEQWQANAPARRKQREECERQRATSGVIYQLRQQDPNMKAIPDERLRAAAESWNSQFELSLPWDVFRSEQSLLKCLPVKTEQLPECRKAAAALAQSNQWFLTYHTFAAEPTPEPLEFTPSIPVLTELLQQNETALDAADLLAALEPEDLAALQTAAHSVNPTTRLAAAQVLWKCKTAPTTEFWLEMLKDPDGKVRDTALTGLGEHWNPALLDKLFVYLRDPQMCTAVASFLSRYQQALVAKKEELLELTKNADPNIQSAAWRLLLLNRQFGLSRQMLLGLLNSTNFFTINTAVLRLQESGGLSSDEAAVLVRSPSPFARLASVRVLTKNADARATELGIQLLRDREELISIKAWQMLRKVTGQDLPQDQPEKWESWWAAEKSKQR